MSVQLELFPEPPHSPRRYWHFAWDWDGPEVGGFCEVADCGSRLADGSGRHYYAYMEQCRVLEQLPGGEWLVEIAMGEVHGHPWSKDGTKLILGEDEINPPTRMLREQRRYRETYTMLGGDA